MSKHSGHKARKRFGQNFLYDQFIIDKIVSAVNPQDDETLIEIGPGLGALTEPVTELVERLTVIELDRDLAKKLRHHPFMNEKLNIIEADALKFDYSSLRDKGPKLRVFGNLPYNISTPLMFHLFQFNNDILDMHFMLQNEVVKRLCANVGDKLYGRLSVMAQYYCKASAILFVPPSAFRPAPKVDSSVVRLVPHNEPQVLINDIEFLDLTVKKAFNQRRKTIRNSLSDLLTPDQIESAGIDPSSRAETLTLKEFAKLSNMVEN